MKISVVTYHLPHPDGTATGRHVFAVWEAARSLGHEVEAWCWGDPPAGLEPPDWVRYERYHDAGGWRRLPTTIRRPRGGLGEVGWEAPADASVAWAEEPESYAAVASAARRGVSLYHSTLLDAVALRRPRAALVQSARAERRAVRHADVPIAFSARVARAVGIRALCPVTLPIPSQPLPLVTEPVALILADWAWPPNQVAMERMLTSWPRVTAQVPEARLLVAGRGLQARATPPGVEVIGEVAHARDALSRAAVFAFPCPSTSGPKMKVLDALAHAVPVVTTEAGVEGIHGVERAAVVCSPAAFGASLADVLGDPERRATMAAAGRAAILEHHSPERAVAARLALIADLPS